MKMTKIEAEHYLKSKVYDGSIVMDGIFYKITFGKSLTTSLPRVRAAIAPFDGEIIYRSEYGVRDGHNNYRTYSDIVFSFPTNEQDPLWNMIF